MPKKVVKKPAKKVAKKPKAKKPVNKVAPKKTVKKAVKKVKKVANEARRVYHVVKRSDGKWEVKYAGGEKAIKLFDRQDEAIVYSRKMSQAQKGVMLVHNSRGKNKGRIKEK